MARKKTYDIFLSHSSSDNDFTNKLHSLLEQAGFNVWYDEKILTSNTHLLTDLPKYIGNSESFIIILSKNSCDSTWVQDEYGYARELHKNKELNAIIPIVIDDCNLPGFFNNYKWIDCKQGLTPFAFFGIFAKKKTFMLVTRGARKNRTWSMLSFVNLGVSNTEL